MPQENQDDIYVLDGRVRLVQPLSGGFRTSLDSVMLAAACPVAADDHVLDLGCGVGSAGLCVLARVPGAKLTGVELQPDVCEHAVENARRNNVHNQTTFVNMDVRDFAVPEHHHMFDHVICNPPYLDHGTYTPSPDTGRGVALGHHGSDMTLNDWIQAAHVLVKSRGTFTMIHRADYIDRILHGMGKRFGAIDIIPLWPRVGQPAKRVIIRAIKDRRGDTTLHAGLVLHEADGSWTDAANRILRDMQAV